MAAGESSMRSILEEPCILPKRQLTRRRTGKNAYRPERNLAQDSFRRRAYHHKMVMKRFAIPVVAFLLGTAVIAGIYLGFLTWVDGWSFALSQLARDRAYIIPIIAAFGLQSALYSILRFRLFIPSASPGPGTAIMGANGGTSATAMIACCLHQVTNVLPILGLSAATTFLTRYQTPFLQLSLVMNLAGILIMLAVLYRERQRMPLTLGTA